MGSPVLALLSYHRPLVLGFSLLSLNPPPSEGFSPSCTTSRFSAVAVGSAVVPFAGTWVGPCVAMPLSFADLLGSRDACCLGMCCGCLFSGQGIGSRGVYGTSWITLTLGLSASTCCVLCWMWSSTVTLASDPVFISCGFCFSGGCCGI